MEGLFADPAEIEDEAAIPIFEAAEEDVKGGAIFEAAEEEAGCLEL